MMVEYNFFTDFKENNIPIWLYIFGISFQNVFCILYNILECFLSSKSYATFSIILSLFFFSIHTLTVMINIGCGINCAIRGRIYEIYTSKCYLKVKIIYIINIKLFHLHPLTLLNNKLQFMTVILIFR